MSADINIQAHLRTLGLSGSLEEYLRQLQSPQSSSLGFDERLSMMLLAQIDQRTNRRIVRKIKEADFRLIASPQEIDYRTSRGITRSQIADILSLGFLRRHHGIIITGATGTGKTYLACAIGTQAITADFSVRYFRLSSLLESIAIARADGTYRSFVAKLRSKDLLIIDDAGLAPIPSRGSRELLDILDERTGVSSTIIATQLTLSVLYQSFEDATVADAILDRLVHTSITLTLEGESMRKQLVTNERVTPDRVNINNESRPERGEENSDT